MAAVNRSMVPYETGQSLAAESLGSELAPHALSGNGPGGGGEISAQSISTGSEGMMHPSQQEFYGAGPLIGVSSGVLRFATVQMLNGSDSHLGPAMIRPVGPSLLHGRAFAGGALFRAAVAGGSLLGRGARRVVRLAERVSVPARWG